MLIDLIEKILTKLFPKTMKQFGQRRFNEGINYQITEYREQRVKDKQFESTKWIGLKVLAFGNEWEDPVFGYVVAHGPNGENAPQPDMVWMRDVMTNEVHLGFVSALSLADNKTIDAILKLDPFERWNIRSARRHPVWSKNYPLGQITKPEDIRQKLIAIGFYDV